MIFYLNSSRPRYEISRNLGVSDRMSSRVIYGVTWFEPLHYTLDKH